MTPEQNKLNMGCGYTKLDGYWNVDKNYNCNPDEVVNFMEPFPWEDNTFESIVAENVLTQIGTSLYATLSEMWRVSQDGADWTISVPHHRCDLFWEDPINVCIITPKTISLFDQKNNHESWKNGNKESAYGFNNNIDIEVVDVNFQFINYWRKQMDEGLLGATQLEIELNTRYNVAESTTINCKIHKPGRYEQWIKNNIRR